MREACADCPVVFLVLARESLTSWNDNESEIKRGLALFKKLSLFPFFFLFSVSTSPFATFGENMAGNGFNYFEIWSHEFDFGTPKMTTF